MVYVLQKFHHYLLATRFNFIQIIKLKNRSLLWLDHLTEGLCHFKTRSHFFELGKVDVLLDHLSYAKIGEQVEV